LSTRDSSELSLRTQAELDHFGCLPPDLLHLDVLLLRDLNLHSNHDVILALLGRDSTFVSSRRGDDLDYLSQRHAPEIHGRPDPEARHRLVEIGLECKRRLEDGAAPQDEENRREHDCGHQDEYAESVVAFALFHSLAGSPFRGRVRLAVEELADAGVGAVITQVRGLPLGDDTA